MVKIANQAAELAFMNGLLVSPNIAKSLLPTPTVSDTFTAGLGSTQQTLGSLHSVSLAQIVNRDDLLPTPTIGHIRNYDEPVEDYLERKAKEASGEYRGIPGISLGVAVGMDLLPTPVASEGTKAPSQQTSETKAKTGQVWLSNVAKDLELLGTPRTSSANAATEKQINKGTPKSRIEDQVLTNTWGRFGPAIERWAKVIGRPAPPATKPDGKDGAHPLSAEFTEWLMGLPAGWVTGVGLTRNEALKACGNGVVPQQAELALRLLLETTPIKGINK
jgi:DNA (cytosine-5)-methyltransferase 1